MMKLRSLFVLLAAVGSISSCQTSQPSQPQTVNPTSQTAPTGAPTEAAARAAIALHLQQQSNKALYQLDSARVTDVDTHWQVMVPRTDWANRMPNAAAFEVDKQTGKVTTLMVK